jgi:hypothetical protein
LTFYFFDFKNKLFVYFLKIEKHLKLTKPVHEDSNSNDSNLSGSGKAKVSSSTTDTTNAIPGPEYNPGPMSHLSLLEQHNELKKKANQLKESEREKLAKEEEKILASVVEHKALLSFNELAKGIQYVDPIKTSWRVPKCISELPQSRHDEVRELTGITIDGEDVPPPIASFKVNSYSTHSAIQ